MSLSQGETFSFSLVFVSWRFYWSSSSRYLPEVTAAFPISRLGSESADLHRLKDSCFFFFFWQTVVGQTYMKNRSAVLLEALRNVCDPFPSTGNQFRVQLYTYSKSRVALHAGSSYRTAVVILFSRRNKGTRERVISPSARSGLILPAIDGSLSSVRWNVGGNVPASSGAL